MHRRGAAGSSRDRQASKRGTQQGTSHCQTHTHAPYSPHPPRLRPHLVDQLHVPSHARQRRLLRGRLPQEQGEVVTACSTAAVRRYGGTRGQYQEAASGENTIQHSDASDQRDGQQIGKRRSASWALLHPAFAHLSPSALAARRALCRTAAAPPPLLPLQQHSSTHTQTVRGRGSGREQARCNGVHKRRQAPPLPSRHPCTHLGPWAPCRCGQRPRCAAHSLRVCGGAQHSTAHSAHRSRQGMDRTAAVRRSAIPGAPPPAAGPQSPPCAACTP